MKLENLKSSFPKKRNWSESLCLKIIKVVQTTTWTKSDINPSDDKQWKPPSSTHQTETISDSEKDADENETEQFDCW